MAERSLDAFKARDNRFVADWLKSKGLHKLCSVLLQPAYRLGHSTETALLKMHNELLMNMDAQRVTLLVLLDLSAAFDTVDHEVLLNRYDLALGSGVLHCDGLPLTSLIGGYKNKKDIGRQSISSCVSGTMERSPK